ncbi:PD-(D/E)XK motif protein [Variovorax ginsengisoli]|uniref:PD-(D/E)XK motif protein n=1 Tax=Variovorax ginsengisoli TaxID=363844 RepID=A0ABT8SDH5_9BURK|nr:PD-(D/E)XK motif protein [Variovorax ginsengisoli]MDN8617293.1 PD-(D/E)XK motif protein [Variovorax ginsengisoli]MDO1536463.1 PD-(D/E)XK motif protein [Variovorax ginsengisoli]
MSLPNDELTLAWASLAKASDSAQGWRSIVISPVGAVPVHAGRRYPGGAEAILVRFPAEVVAPGLQLPGGAGFLVERTSLGDAVTWIALTRREDGNVDMFAAMATDVAAALAPCPAADGPRAVALLLGRVRAWQEFMRKGGQPLGPEAETGLFGELEILLALLDQGLDPVQVCEAWRGPLDGLRDFELGTGGIEVKTTLATDGFPARVASLDQLDDTQRQPLFLAAVRLRQTGGGRSLPEIIGVARECVSGDAQAQRLLDECLLASGYREEHAAHYIRTLAVTQVRFLHVDAGFPRLTSQMVPQGVLRASYAIDVDKAQTPDAGLREALTQLKAI